MGSSWVRNLVVFCALLGTLICTDNVRAQAPELPPQWFENRTPSLESQTLSFCVDPREPAHEVDRALAEQVAAALLVEPTIHIVERLVIVELEYEGLYVDLVDHCSVYLGFKLYPGTYPTWLNPTAPFYQARFVVLTAHQEWQTLDDIPRDVRIGAVQGTLGDIRFITLNNALPQSERWPRAPVGRPEQAFNALMNGVVGALIVWEPWWWALSRTRPELGDLRVLDTPDISEPWIEVGGMTLSDRGYIRTSVDQALAILSAEGAVQETLDSFDFPGRAFR